ncbi:MAG: hypothetical protein JST84_21500 [Acidobacteria bacterium]|nr:hypothetical protein [Acidobacteriota bacterium]
MSHHPICRKANIVVRELENEVLLYDLTLHKAYCLNQPAALVYQFCDGTNSVAEISDLMSKRLKILVSEDLVWLALKDLERQNLLENEEAFTPQVAGLSRRTLLKKARLASIGILPIIVSIVAPVAVAAATCIPFSAPCVPGDNCCPNSICEPVRNVCGCQCVTPGDCLTQTVCPSTVNCNSNGVCAP